MDFSYWHKQKPDTPLYPEIEWNKPERRTQAGKIAVIGGTSHGFMAVSDAHQTALDTGIGSVRLVLPDALKKTIPPTITDVVFTPSTASGGLIGDPVVDAALAWADMRVLVGDAGRSAETAAAYEHLLQTTEPLVVTRDAVDLLKAASQTLVEREATCLVVSFSQLQKLFQSIYYPKMLSFSMQLTTLVETLHKFTLTYPVLIATYHHDQLVIAHGGTVTTTSFDNPMAIWRGIVATRIACYWLWNPKQPFEAATASVAPTSVA